MDDASDPKKNVAQRNYESIFENAERSASDDNPEDRETKDADLDRSQNQSQDENGQPADQPNRWDTNVTGQDANDNSNNNQGGLFRGGKFGGFTKKGLPTLLILMTLVGGGSAIVGSQALQGFAIANRLIQEDNSMGVVSHIRSRFFLKRILGGSSGDGGGTVFDQDKFQLSEAKQADFKRNGIDYKGSSLEYDGKSITASNLDESLRDMPDFEERFTTSSATWDNQNSGWYDNLTDKFLTRIGLSRNRFSDFEKTRNQAADTAKFEEAAKNDQENRGVGVYGEEEHRVEEDEDADADDSSKTSTDTDTDEKTDKYVKNDTVSDSPDNERIVKTDTEESIKSKLKSKVDAISGGIGFGVNARCALMTIADTINNLANAAELLQILNFTNGFLEGVQKVNAGLGAEAPIGEYLTRMNTLDGETRRTGMQAAGMIHLFGGKFDPYEKSAQTYNFEKTNHSLFHGVVPLESMTADDLKTCDYSRMAVGISDLAIAGLSIALASTGVGAVVAAMFAGIRSFVMDIAISTAASFLIDMLAPKIAAMVTRELVSDVLGPDLGNALVTGGRSYLGFNHRQRGGSGGSEAAVLAFHNEQETVLAEWADYERRHLSPFDATSSNTFLGALYANLMPLAINSGSLFGNLSNISSVTLQSFGKLLPSASAQTMENTYLMREKGIYCEVSGTMQVMSDMYCNPFIVSDTNTIRQDPAEIYQAVLPLGCENGNENFVDGCSGTPQMDKDNNPVINTGQNSNLFKFATFCGQRQINYGYADSSVTAALAPTTGNTVLDNFIGRITDALPFIDDVKDIIETARNELNAKWISGAYCVNSPVNDKWDSEMKYYQRYLEDQGVMEAMGIVEQSSLEVALDTYFERNPVEDSYAGRLAYLSGESLEDTKLALDLIEYYQLLAEYEPGDSAPTFDELKTPNEDNAFITFLFDGYDFAPLEMQEPLITGPSELEREVAFRQDKRPVNQSV